MRKLRQTQQILCTPGKSRQAGTHRNPYGLSDIHIQKSQKCGILTKLIHSCITMNYIIIYMYTFVLFLEYNMVTILAHSKCPCWPCFIYIFYPPMPLICSICTYETRKSLHLWLSARLEQDLSVFHRGMRKGSRYLIFRM